MKRVMSGLALVLTCALGCNGVGEEESTTSWDASWVIGPVFEGYYGLPVGETTSVNYFILHEDGVVERGSTFLCEPNEAMIFGTWSQTEPNEVEIRSNEESWPGNPNLDVIRLRRTEDCQRLEAFEVRIDGSLTTKGGHTYSRGIPCLSECDGFGDRDIIVCAGEPELCQ